MGGMAGLQKAGMWEGACMKGVIDLDIRKVVISEARMRPVDTARVEALLPSERALGLLSLWL